MKVRISFTVDIDPEMWAHHHGEMTASMARRHVKAWAESEILTIIDDLELPYESNRQD